MQKSIKNEKWPRDIDSKIFIGELDFFADPSQIVDYELLNQHLRELKEGKPVSRPSFDFKNQKRTEEVKIRVLDLSKFDLVYEDMVANIVFGFFVEPSGFPDQNP